MRSGPLRLPWVGILHDTYRGWCREVSTNQGGTAKTIDPSPLQGEGVFCTYLSGSESKELHIHGIE